MRRSGTSSTGVRACSPCASGSAVGPHPNPRIKCGAGSLPQGEGIRRLTRGRLRQLQRLRTARERREQGLFLIDGEKLVREAIAAEAPIAELLSTSPEQWADTRAPLTKISQADAERLSDTRTPQGHFALVHDELGSAQHAVGRSNGRSWSSMPSRTRATSAGSSARPAAFEVDSRPGRSRNSRPDAPACHKGGDRRVVPGANRAIFKSRRRRGRAAPERSDRSGGRPLR